MKGTDSSLGKTLIEHDDDDEDKQENITFPDYEYDYKEVVTVTEVGEFRSKFRLISRKEWKAEPPVMSTPLTIPVPFVIIHETSTEPCSFLDKCATILRSIQTADIKSRGFTDIAHNFLVGGDGVVYEGRGWTQEGSHTSGYNDKSISVAFIGTFVTVKPTLKQLLAAERLIVRGLRMGNIKQSYKLMGSKQLSTLDLGARKLSPTNGSILFEVIKTWPHWAARP